MVDHQDPVEKAIATDKLDTLLQKPEVKVLPASDGSVKVTTLPWWQRCWQSWVIRIQAVGAVFVTIWLSIPQDAFVDVIPNQYQKYGVLTYVVVTALARMRTI